MDPLQEIEMMCRSILQRAGAREYTLTQSAPEVQTAEFRSGYAEGQLTGQLTTAAIMLGLATGDSPSRILDEARAQAQVENAFPFDLHMTGLDDKMLPVDPDDPPTAPAPADPA